jgi:predicted permease
MKLNEAAVFKWVVIVGIAAATVIVLTLLTSQLVGALWGLLLVIAGCVYGYRWAMAKRRETRSLP